MKSVSIVVARRELGRLANEVRRTARPVVLTRRGKPIARLVPAPEDEARDGLAGLVGSIEMTCSRVDLERSIRELRSGWNDSLDRPRKALRRNRRRSGE